jgi:uncharacterized protein (TIGR01777 family)
MKILVSGASGMVGRALLPRLAAAGHEVGTLARHDPGKNSIRWDVETGELDAVALMKFGQPDAVIHLAGENIAGQRWSKEKKRRIRSSRVEATQRLAVGLLQHKPRTFISASAVGYYGDRGDELLTEDSPGGNGFLPDVCEAWENAAQCLVTAGVRVVYLRFGMILSADGGALAKMLPFFKAGVGGRVGSGRQWGSWITLEDVLRTIEFCLSDSKISGAYNVVSPKPVRNREFTMELARALKRPALIPVPGWALRLLYGEMADALLLSSQRVIPHRLQGLGFKFQHPDLADALQHALYRR